VKLLPLRRIVIEVTEDEYADYLEKKGARTWKEILQQGLARDQEKPFARNNDGDLMLDVEWLDRIERDFIEYFRGMSEVGNRTVITRYKREYGWNWLKAKTRGLKLDENDLMSLLVQLETRAMQGLKESSEIKRIGLTEQQLKIMKEKDYRQFKLFLAYLSDRNELDYKKIDSWILSRIAKYGDHYSRQELIRDFLVRYEKECHELNKPCDIPIDTWIKQPKTTTT